MFDSDNMDSDYFHRRIRNLGSVLAVPIDLKDGEHLRDAVMRATSQNGYQRTKIAIDLANTRSFRTLAALKSTAAADDIERLVDVLGIRRDAEQIKKILANGNQNSREFSSFFGHSVRRAHFTSNRRVSPTSLQASAHQKAVWSIRWLSCDPETMERLIDRCPVCQCPLGWDLTHGVSFCGRCKDPKVDLRDFPQPKVEAFDEEALRFFANLLNPSVSDADFSSMHPTSSLKATRGEAFEFIIRLAMECERFEIARRGVMSAIQSKNLERAARALLNWPSNFLVLLDTLSAVVEDTRVLNSLRHDRAISANIRQVLKEILEVRQRRRAMASLSRGSTGVLPRAAVHAVSPIKRGRAALYDLIKRPGAIPDRTEATMTVVRDVRAVRLRSQGLGLTVPDTVELYLAGYNSDLRADLLPLGIVPDSSTLKPLFREIVESQNQGVRSDRISLVTAKFILDESLTFKWSDIIQAIVDGRLPVRRTFHSGKGLMHDLVLDDFARFREVMATASLDCRFRHVRISVAEMAMQMGKSPTYAALIAKLFGIQGTITAHKMSEIRKAWVLGFELEGLARIQEIEGFKSFEKLTSAKVRNISHSRITAWARAEALACLHA